jgi:hypothetical protein
MRVENKRMLVAQLLCETDFDFPQLRARFLQGLRKRLTSIRAWVAETPM